MFRQFVGSGDPAIQTTQGEGNMHIPRVIRLAGLILLGFLWAPSVALAQGPDNPPQVHEVVFSVDQRTGEISFSLDPVIVEQGRGDRIRFSATGVDSWAVSFAEGSATPFSNRVIEGTGEQPRNVPILPNVATGTYKYDVSVTVGGSTWTVDPEIIVRARRGG